MDTLLAHMWKRPHLQLYAYQDFPLTDGTTSLPYLRAVQLQSTISHICESQEKHRAQVAAASALAEARLLDEKRTGMARFCPTEHVDTSHFVREAQAICDRAEELLDDTSDTNQYLDDLLEFYD